MTSRCYVYTYHFLVHIFYHSVKNRKHFLPSVVTVHSLYFVFAYLLLTLNVLYCLYFSVFKFYVEQSVIVLLNINVVKL